MAKPSGLLALIGGKAESEDDESDGEISGANAMLDAIAAKDAAGMKAAFKTMYRACAAELSAEDSEDEDYE